MEIHSKEFNESLGQVKYCIIIDNTESQGIAIQEMMDTTNHYMFGTLQYGPMSQNIQHQQHLFHIGLMNVV